MDRQKMEMITGQKKVTVDRSNDAVRSDDEDIPDKSIVKEVLNGDTNRFELLVNRYRSLLFAIISKHIPHEMVEEVAQDSFIRIYQSLNNFRGEGTFKSWITKITYRTCYDFWRVRYRQREISLEPIHENQKQWLNQLEALRSKDEFNTLIARQEAKEVLDWALNRLSAEDRMVLTLFYLEEHSVKETAHILGWSPANVKIRAFRSRKKLLKIINAMK